MRKALLPMFMVLFAAGLTFLPGCDKESTAPKLKTGDTTDVGFLVVKSLLGDAMMAHDGDLVDLSLELSEQIPGGSPRLPRPFKASGSIDSLFVQSYTYSDYWHIFACSAYVADDSDGFFLFTGIDSLRFADSAGYLQYPDSTITSMNIRYHFQVEAAEDLNLLEMADHGRWDISGEWENYMVISGHSSDSIDFLFYQNDTAYCDIGITLGQNFNDLYLDSLAMDNQGCPPSGSIGLAATIDIECVNVNQIQLLDISGAWVAGFAFNDPNMTATFSDGTTLWTVVEECRGNDMPKRGVSKIMASLRELKR